MSQRTAATEAAASALAAADDVQRGLMEEACILVGEDDAEQRPASKLDCHLWANIEKAGMLHRAFSVFLFDSKGRLLLQQRSADKITFPLVWANTCCSHPLWTPEERDCAGNIGVRRAAQRKLQHELGIPPEQVPLESMKWLTRIQYRAAAPDGVWGEHELDHILVVQADVTTDVNANEIAQVRYFTKEEAREALTRPAEHGMVLSPWFGLLAERKLFWWWDNLGDLSRCVEPDTIHRW